MDSIKINVREQEQRHEFDSYDEFCLCDIVTEGFLWKHFIHIFVANHPQKHGQKEQNAQLMKALKPRTIQ